MLRQRVRFITAGFALIFSQAGAFEKANQIESTPGILADQKPGIEVGYGEDGVTPIYFRTKLPALNQNGLAKLSGAASPQEREHADCRRFLAMVSRNLKGFRSESDFRIETGKREFNRSHFHVRQLAKGIPIFGAEGKVVLRANSEGIYLGRFRNAANSIPSPVPTISAKSAREVARKELGLSPEINAETPVDTEEVSQRERFPELVYFPTDSLSASPSLRLAWHLAVRANILELWEYLIDAQDGRVLLKFPDHCEAGATTATAPDLSGTARTFGTYQNAADSKYYLIDAARPMFNASRSRFPDQTVGTILTMDMNNTPQSRPVYNHITSTNNAWSNPTAVSAHYNATVAYEYYRKTFGRNSINGNGGNIRSFINVPGTDGRAMDNAFWNGNAMYYGNGRTSMKPLAGALDVAGHELTHGVVGATAALRYLGQSGALNESMADIFGAMIERLNWKLGEDIVKPAYFSTGAIRDLSNPNQGLKKGSSGWQPAHMNEYQTLPNTEAGDMGGVHVNSGITNRAFYLFATAVGKEKAEQVYYKALTQYLTASSQFTDMRLAVTTACQDLYGAGSVEEKAAAEAFSAVGIGAPPAVTPKVSTLALHSGLQFALLTRAGAGDGNTLYLMDSGLTNPKPLSRTPLFSRPSVTDDGSTAIFVSKDGRIMQLKTDAANPQESVLESNPVWEIAAISKDGKRYAALKKSHDSSVYVFEIGTGKSQRFPLYNPTNEGIRTGGVMYAGSLDWDNSGENVIYDAFNHLQGTGTSAIEYWDVGLMNVWDTTGKQFAAGDIRKPLGDLPDGASVGNPVFAKNSPDVVVYEYIDDITGLSIRTIDLETRKSGTLTTNTIIGFPSYDKRDASIAFTTLSGTDTVIAMMGLKADKITSGSAPRTVATGYKWPVLFARGNRLGNSTPLYSPMSEQALASGFRVHYQAGSRQLQVKFFLDQNTAVRLSAYAPDGKSLGRKSVLGLTGANTLVWPMENASAFGVRFFRLEAQGIQLQTRALMGD